MRTIIITIAVILTFGFCNSAQSQIRNVEYKVNTINGNELQYWIYLETGKEESVSPTFWKEPGFPKDLTVEIRDESSDDIIGEGKIKEGIGGIPGNKFLIISFTKLPEKEINMLLEAKKSYYLSIKKELDIQLIDSNDIKTGKLLITPEVLKNATMGKLKLSKNYVDLLVKSSGNISLLYDNFIDLSTEVATNDSEKTNYVVKFNYHSLYSNKTNWISWATKGRIATKENDPLSEFAIYPVYLSKVFFPDNLVPAYEISLLAGMESNQKFTMQRVGVTGSVQSLFPNIIDFTGGENRLRLKPVIKIGAKGLFEYQDKRLNQTNDNDGEVFTELYYYIPVFKMYSLLIVGDAFNVFTGRNSGYGWKYKYDLTFGLEIPGTELKVIAKYSQGGNDVNYSYDSQLLLGFMLDFFERK